MTTMLHLIRHGETNWNAEGRIQGQMESVLTDLGQQQASALREKLRHYQFDQLFCSSSKRAQQTAALAFGDRRQAITTVDALREIYLADWEGHLYADIEGRDPEGIHAFRHQPHLFKVAGAETFYQLQARALNAVAAILAQCSGLEVAVVSHGAWIKSVLSHYEDRPIERFWEPPRMHNCCHSIIKISDDGASRIVRYADLDTDVQTGTSG